MVFAFLSAALVFNPASAESLRVWLDGKGKKAYDPEASIYAAAPFMSAVFGHLLHTDSSYNLKPGLLKSWRWDFKEKVYILELREGLFFHSGRPVTAKDLEFSILRGFFSSRASFYRQILSNLEGTDKIEVGQSFKPGAVSGVTVLDERRLKIKLQRPNPSFLHSLSYSYLSIVPQEALRDDYFTWKDLPVGAGPYKVVNSDSQSSRIRLEAVYGSGPKVVEVFTENDRTGADLLLWVNSSPEMNKMKRVIGPQSNSATMLFFNYEHPLGNDIRFRKALSAGLRRQALVTGQKAFKPTYELLPSHFWGRAGIADPYDQAEAKKLLAEVRKAHPELLNAPIRVSVRTSDFFEDSIKLLKEQFDSLGLQVDIFFDTEKHVARSETGICLFVYSLAFFDLDPLLKFWNFVRYPNNPLYNAAPPKDERLLSLLEEAGSAESFDVRVETIKSLSQYVIDQSFVVPLYERLASVIYNPSVISDLGHQDGFIWFYLNHLKLQKKPRNEN